ncbi:MAG: serine/threonine-protein phosphatase [Deltaproteobacteria bacterium]|nr:serine/threonine-protein phosphatase [Deltaproteobacteria bacterium]
MLWIGIAIAAAFVLLLVVRAMGDAGKAATEPALPGGGKVPEAPVAQRRVSVPPKDKEEDEPEGTKVASVPPPGSNVHKEMSVVEPLPDVPLEMSVEDDPTGPQALILVTAVGRTDPGRRRKHNEDSYLVMEDQAVFAIADGMGGYAAGEVASQLAVDVISEAFSTATFTGDPDPNVPRRGDELIRAISMANTAILTQARANEAQSGMGTTIVSCRFSPNKQRVYIAHVGDSRCYRVRGDEIKQLTIDHTLGAVGITGPAASKLSRAVGIQDTVEVDLSVDAPRVHDYFLLCSDGLSKMVPEEMIRDIVRESPDLATAVERLVSTANDRGGRDNVTVILIRVQEPPKP